MLLPWATLALAQEPPQDFSLQMFSVPGEMENFSSFSGFWDQTRLGGRTPPCDTLILSVLAMPWLILPPAPAWE